MSGNRSLFRNALYLMTRLFVALVANIYISREVLSALGVSDYGVFNIVNGTVLMLTSLTGSLSSAVSRFINYELGKNNIDNVTSIFSMSIFIHAVLSLVVLAFSYYSSDYLVMDFLNIPSERWGAAENILHITSFSFACILLSVSFISLIISHEDIRAYAAIGLMEVALKLMCVMVLLNTDFDKLELHASLLSLVNLVMLLCYVTFCMKKYVNIRFNLSINTSLMYKLSSFVGWNAIGSASFILKEHGVNILLNVFFGTVVNAAKGIAFQLCSAIQSVVGNLVLAVSPRITKLYSEGKKSEAVELMFDSSRYSFILSVTISFPLYCYASFILDIWLGNVPDYAINFLKLMLVNLVLDSFSGPLISMMLATGNIKWYQIIVGGLNALNLPLSYFILSKGGMAESTIYISIFISICCLLLRIYMLGVSLKMSIFSRFFYKTKELIFLMTTNFIMYIFCFSGYVFTGGGGLESSFFLFGFFLLQCGLIYVICLSCNEKKFISNKVRIFLRSINA